MPDTLPRAGVYGRQSRGNVKSIADQLAECVADAEVQGWTITGRWQDGSSASRHRRKDRDDWARVLAAIDAGDLDVLVLWESSRGDRDLPTWAGLLATCRDRRVLIRVTSHHHTYDMANPRDWRTLAEDGVDSAYESEKLSQRVRRGVASAARAGRPAMGPAPYGYLRVYDPRTGALVGQEPDPVTAPIVREIIDQVARSVPVSAIAADLNARGVPAPGGGRWRRLRVRLIALNPAYIGRRRHRGETYDAAWEPLVDEATHYAAARVLTDPARMDRGRHTLPGKLRHLLSHLATCHLGHPLRARAAYYTCAPGCVGIGRGALDGLVRDTVCARLARPDAYQVLRQAGADADQEVVVAQAEEARLRARLTEWRVSAAAGLTTPESLAVIEADLTRQIRDAQARADRLSLPVALRPYLEPGADLRARWDADTVQARRDVVRALVVVRVLPARQSSRVPTHERVDIAWRSAGGTSG